MTSAKHKPVATAKIEPSNYLNDDHVFDGTAGHLLAFGSGGTLAEVDPATLGGGASTGTAYSLRGFKAGGTSLDVPYVTPEMFGAIPNDSSSAAKAANDAAFKAACEYRPQAGSDYGVKVQLGPCTYYLGATLEPEGSFHLAGHGTGHVSGGVPGTAMTRLVFPADTTCIRVRISGTEANAFVVGKIGADDSRIEGISIEQATLGTVLTAHGVEMKRTATIDRCLFVNIAGDAVHIFAQSDSIDPVTYGAADEWRVINSYVHSCGGNGLYVNGNEANAGYSQGVVFHQCGGCAILDASYLPNAHRSVQITGYGNTGVYYSGFQWQLNVATNTGTAPGTDGTWYKLQTGTSGGNARFPDWNVGTAYKAQLPFLIFNGSPIDGYQEFGQVYGHGGVVLGGNLSSTRTTPRLGAYGASMVGQGGFGQYYSVGGNTADPLYASIGDEEFTLIGRRGGDASAAVRRAYPMQHRLKGYDLLWGYGMDGLAAGDDLQLGYFNGPSMLSIVTPWSSKTFGRSTAQTQKIYFGEYGLQDPNDGNTARLHWGTQAAPSSGNHCQGEFAWNLLNPSAGILGWSCTATGTPGTWTPVYAPGAMPSGTITYRKTAGSGAPEFQTLATLKTDLGLTGTNSGDQIITLTGDVTGSGTGSFAATLANSGVSAGSYGSSSAIPVLTIDAKGRVTAASTAAAGLTRGQAIPLALGMTLN